MCTSCNFLDDSCTLDCSVSDCSGGVDLTCPDGFHCRIECVGAVACLDDDITCHGDCSIRCEGTSACRDAAVACDGPRCDIGCTGDNACLDQVDCNADSCVVICDGVAACDGPGGVCCGEGSCGVDCSSANNGNCDCPA
jgi:hypothetical protein